MSDIEATGSNADGHEPFILVGDLRTMDPSRPKAEAMAVEAGRKNDAAARPPIARALRVGTLLVDSDGAASVDETRIARPPCSKRERGRNED